MITADDLMPVEPFADLPEDDRAWLAERCEEVVIAAGEHPFETGEPADRAVVRQHGGHVTVESRPGRTVFTVMLPLDGSRPSGS